MFTMWTHRFDLIVYEVLKSRNKRHELKGETCILNGDNIIRSSVVLICN